MSKNALVTGAGTGIGRAIARVLAKAGYDVGLHCNASRDGAESAAAEIRTLGRHAEVFQADLSDLNAIGGMFEAMATMLPLPCSTIIFAARCMQKYGARKSTA